MSQAAVNSGFTAGDHVRILEAEPGTPDPKALIYYGYYGNLTGTVVKAYDDGTIAVSVDRSALPAEVRARHEDGERMLRDRWLGSLSEEERGRLTQREQKFSLRYTILVASKHVVPESGGDNSAGKSHPAKRAAQDAAAPPRPSSSDLDAAEEQYLRSKQDGAR